jgi:DNA mismatch repair protein MutS
LLGGVNPQLLGALESALVDQPGPHLSEGGYVREGHREDLDAARALRDQSRKVIAELEARYRDETGIKTLKIRHNGFLGYYIEVNAAAGEALLNKVATMTSPTGRPCRTPSGFPPLSLQILQARIDRASDEAMRIERHGVCGSL